MIAVLAAIVQTTLTPPDGTWISLLTQDSGSNLRMWAYYKFASGEAAGASWGLASATKCWGWVGAYAGFDQANAPVAAGAASLTTPSLAVPANGYLITAGAGRHANTGAATSYTSSDGADLELLDFGSNVTASNDVSGAVYDSNRALAAGNYTRTLNPSQAEALAASIAISFGPDTTGGGGGGTIQSTAGARWGIHV
jgi:hypothetical protein